MNTRLVVYRREATSDDLYDLKEYELDLDKAPNISVNYNWLDIREPDNKKSSFSQTIKIPFSDRNNEFFENWFDVNLDSLVYNTKTKFRAIIMTGSVPQLEGYIQLKSIYLNARKYEVVVFGDTANFFNDIKGKKLYDAFTTESEDNPGAFIIDNQLDHNLTRDNIIASWESGLTTVNSITDDDVMYPIIDYGHTRHLLSDAMFWHPQYFADDQGYNNGGGAFDQFGLNTWQEVTDWWGMLKVGMLKPSIRIQRLLQIICQKAGYEIKSTFLGISGNTLTDTSWFSRLFMTLADQYEKVQTKYVADFLVTAPTQSFNSYDLFIPNFTVASYDPNNLYDLTNDAIVFSQESLVNGSATISYTVNIDIPQQNSGGTDLEEVMVLFNVTYEVPGNEEIVDIAPAQQTVYMNGAAINNLQLVYTPTIENVSPGATAKLKMFVYHNPSGAVAFELNSASATLVNNGDTLYSNGIENQQVIMAQNMPDITQSDFVKDLFTRFNLIVLTDLENPNRLVIEPYQDYIASGNTQYWTDKLDMSKEQIVKTTNELQSKEYMFTDLEGEDYVNKSYQNKYGNRVYGSYQLFNKNDFAQEQFKNNSIFSPFTVLPFGGASETTPNAGVTLGQDIAIHHAWKLNEDGVREICTDSNPKLFYYSGTPLSISGTAPDGTGWFFSIFNPDWSYTEDDATSTGNKFPLCLPYNLDTITDITTSTKQLFWTYYSPHFSAVNYTDNLAYVNLFGNTVTEHGYFYDYWSQYINELVSDEARIMECYLNLNEDDIFNFAFKNPVYIKNTLWRVLSIENYVVGGKESTKVKLLKAIEKLNYDCAVIPNTYNANGTISFIDPATGGSADVTNDCCEGLNSNWTFVQTNDSTGVGNCYHNGITATTNPSEEDTTNWQTQAMMVQGGGGAGILPVLKPTGIFKGFNNAKFQSGTITAQAITEGTTTNYFAVDGVNTKMLQLPNNTMAYLNMEIVGVLLNGSNVGEVGYFNYYTVLKNLDGVSSSVGSSGGISKFVNKESNFDLPTFNMTNIGANTGVLRLSVTAGGGTDMIRWSANINFIVQPIRSANAPAFLSFAVFQNADSILFQDNSFLVWN
jgi:hypothetical protein